MCVYLHSKFQGSRLGPVLALLEPVLMVFALYLLRTVIKQSPNYYGTSMMLFYASGIFPYYLFLFVSSRASAARLTGSNALPGRTQLDYFLAAAIVEALIVLAMMGAFFLVLWLADEMETLPPRPDDCVMALLAMGLLGAGVGLLNQTIAKLFPIWLRIYGFFTRGMMFFSGVFVMSDQLPLAIRNVVEWVPMLHAIEWLRLGIYGNYPALLLDRGYLIEVTLSVVFLSIVFERVTIRKRYAGAT
jgi:capsular polysaccharide transport system permease protein